MFEQTLIAPSQTRRERAIFLALLAQTALVTGIGLLSLLRVQALGPVKLLLALPPIQVASQTPEKPQAQAPQRAKPLFTLTSLRPRMPNVELATIGPLSTPAPLAEGYAVGSPGFFPGVPGGEMRVAPPVTPSPAVVKPDHPVRLTSDIAQSKLVYGPKPVYPRLAVMSRSEGTVRLQAMISRDGKIEDLHVITGPALLSGAAMEAVQTWRYRPLLLNGEPVEVITEIDVVFTLQH